MAGHKVHIVFVNPERKSFGGAMLDVGVESLKSSGHEVTVSDLYSDNFYPAFGRKDIKGDLTDTNHLRWLKEMYTAYAQGLVAEDIQSEQRKIDAADLVVFQFPMCWMGFPAMLKGWFDRVMHIGYAFSQPDMIFETARCKGKKAILSFTTGSPEHVYTPTGRMGDMNVILWPLQNGILRFLGFDILAPNIVYNVYGTTEHDKHLAAWGKRLKSIFDEQPLTFLRGEDFENDTLKKSVTSNLEGSTGPTIGQHCGMKLPAGSQTKIPEETTKF